VSNLKKALIAPMPLTNRRPQMHKCFQKKWANFPKKIRGIRHFSPLGKTGDLLRKRASRSVRETFTEGSGTTCLSEAARHSYGLCEGEE
jgi:hypothetical protein